MSLPEIVIALQTFYYTLHKRRFTRLNMVAMVTIMTTANRIGYIVFTCILGLQTLHKYLLETSYM